MVSSQLKREIYILEIVFGKVAVVKSSIQHLRIVVPYQHSNKLTLELKAAALEKVLRNLTESEISKLFRSTN